MTLDQFKTLPNKTQAYGYAMHLRKQNGQGIISPEQFERETDPSSMERIYDRMGQDPAFKQQVIDKAKAGAMTIGEKVDTAQKLGEVKEKGYFKSQAFDDDFGKFTSSKEYTRGKAMAEDPTSYAIRNQVQWREDAITRNGGTIVGDPVPSPGKVTFTVRWKDGTTEVLSYGIRQ
jgi:hypothetical protein